jgi:hypothetical protein
MDCKKSPAAQDILVERKSIKNNKKSEISL